MNTREPKASEQAIFDRFRALVDDEKKASNRIYNLISILNNANISFSKYLPPFNILTPADETTTRGIIDQIEFADYTLNQLLLGNYYFRPANGDIDVLSLTKPKAEPIGFGIAPLILLIAGFVVVASGVAWLLTLRNKRIALENDLTKRLADLDKWAAQQTPDIRAAWSTFKTQNSETAGKRSVWDSIAETAGSIMWIAIAVLAIVFLSKGKGDSK